MLSLVFLLSGSELILLVPFATPPAKPTQHKSVSSIFLTPNRHNINNLTELSTQKQPTGRSKEISRDIAQSSRLQQWREIRDRL